MKSSTRYVILCTILFCLSIADANPQSEKEIEESRAQFKQILEITNFIVTHDVVKTMASNFKYLAPLLGPVGAVLSGVLFFMGTQEKTELANFEEIKSKLDDLGNQVDMIESQLTMMQLSMEAKIKIETATFKTFTSFVSLEDRINQIKVERDRLDIIIDASTWLKHASERRRNNQTTDDAMMISQYGDDKKHMLGRLLSFAEKIALKPVSSHIVQALEDDSKSITNSFYYRLIEYGGNGTQSRWSISTMIFMIHMRVTMYAFEEIAIAEYATVLHGNITGTELTGVLSLLSSTRVEHETKLATHANSVSAMLNSDHCFERPKLSILPAERVVKLKNLIQVFWETEKQMSRRYPNCTEKCDHGAISYKKNRCFGTVHSCRPNKRQWGVMLEYQDPQEDRIYTRVYDDDSANDNDYSSNGRRSLIMENYGWHHQCHICKCLCDQHNFRKTTRRFYKLPIAAQQDQHVVTGVRFVEFAHTIFLQIQTGKIQSFGLIDQSTVRWQDLPKYVRPNETVILGSGRRSVLLNNIAAINESSVVTGFSFEEDRFGANLRILKKVILDWSTGELGPQYPEKTASGYTQVNNYDEPYRKIEGVNPKIPTAINFTQTEAVRYVFGPSGEQDFGQTCLPQFDGSNIEFGLHVPLSHVKFIRYSNDDEYAGYIRPVLRSLNYNHWYFSKAPANEYENIETLL